MTIQPEKDFALRNRLCFYECENLLSPEKDLATVYSAFAKSSFITTYASTNSADDFAEAWETRWTLEYKKSDVILKVSPTFQIKTSEIYYSERFRKKREFIEKFVKGSIKYL